MGGSSEILLDELVAFIRLFLLALLLSLLCLFQ
jgi:hypothetical protein